MAYTLLNTLKFFNRDELEILSPSSRCVDRFINKAFTTGPLRLFDKLDIRTNHIGNLELSLWNGEAQWLLNNPHNVKLFKNGTPPPDRMFEDVTYAPLNKMSPFLGIAVRVKSTTISLSSGFNQLSVLAIEKLSHIWTDRFLGVHVSYEDIQNSEENESPELRAEKCKLILNSIAIVKGCKQLCFSGLNLPFHEFPILYTQKIVKFAEVLNIQSISPANLVEFIEGANKHRSKTTICVFVSHFSQTRYIDTIREVFAVAREPNPFKVFFLETATGESIFATFRDENMITHETLEMKEITTTDKDLMFKTLFEYCTTDEYIFLDIMSSLFHLERKGIIQKYYCHFGVVLHSFLPALYSVGYNQIWFLCICKSEVEHRLCSTLWSLRLMEIPNKEAQVGQPSEQCAMGRYGVNRSACLLTLGILFFVMLLINNLLTTFSGSDVTVISKDASDDLNYGIIIDAGSTGSRLFLYSWRSNSDQELIDIRAVEDNSGQPVVKKVSPGLSSFSENPEAAPEYIRPLLDYAAEFVASEKHPSTPVFIFATAGMRLLNLEKQNGIIKNLQQKLPDLTQFQVLSQHIQVISGKWEGIYSWTAINYMLGRFNFPESKEMYTGKSSESTLPSKIAPLSRPSTAGMIDMGGASAQIAFELPAENNFSDESVQLVNLGCRDDDQRFLYQIFVTTFLGFGVNEGAKKYERTLEQKISNASNENKNSPIVYVRDGCLPTNFLKLANKNDGTQFVRKGTGRWDSCVEEIAQLLFKAPGVRTCPNGQTCYFGGVVAPPLSLSQIELYGFSEYWFSVEDVLSLGGVYVHDEFEKKARAFCSQDWPDIQKKVRANLFPKANEDRIETQCFKSAWIHAILHNGFFVDEKQHNFQSAFKIKGEEVQWALGAMIYTQRYFPLLATRNRDLLSRRHIEHNFSDSSTGWLFFYLLAIIVLIAILCSSISSKLNAKVGVRGLRRDNSIWGYMMLSQNEQENSFGNGSSYSYRINQLAV
ncbi:GDA1/CD39 (nucleoside phosphatase) family domain-containing protein [Ditylenchus destructor]|uniref:GDA1/CD39 (Nucleoside phosphatase) family domain-containing protein n=1 Tax=Ditylenchus destructor TaxID=166010 RepID=A0AAD4N6I6_9BILA|nr:GDA1/CD39 (nucleoside phosphatase) family domain-containing protein [Ditylenchus destructor]